MNGINISTASEIYFGNTLVSEIYFGSNKLWPLGHDYSQDYLTFKSTSNNNIIGWAINDGSDITAIKSISVSTDNGSTWTRYNSSTIPVTLATLNNGDKLLIKGNNISYGQSDNNKCNYFTSSGTFEVEGNIMSLLYGDNFVGQTSLSTDYTFKRLFFQITGITNIKNLVLPATTLANYCYYAMFQGCTSLTTAPELPATTLANYCYSNMFQGCTSLTTAPELPATTLASGCYSYIFEYCTSLITAPVLPATTLATYCYNSMFYGCTSLITAPVLPATTLVTACYTNMFQGCTSLTTAPELPATTLATYCYQNMFNGCTSLTTAPVLPVTTLVQACYRNMFQNCTNLNYIKCLATDISASNCTTTWVNGVSATGTFVKNASMTSWTTGNNGIPSGWIVQNVHDYSQDYLTFEALEPGTFTWYNNNETHNVFYSTDNGTTWTEIAAGVPTETINTGHKIILKANWQYNYPGYFIATGRFNVMGNIMSLVYSDLFINNNTLVTMYCFFRLFYNCSTLVDASNLILPATTLTRECYEYMFEDCTSLTTAPALPATTLATGCYAHMFDGCTSLTTAPSELPATTLANNCYQDMFYRCSSLTTAPELPATTLANYCYQNMFTYCTSLNYIKCLATDISATGCTTTWTTGVSATGTFVKDASMTSWTTGTSGIPLGWTVQNA